MELSISLRRKKEGKGWKAGGRTGGRGKLKFSHKEPPGVISCGVKRLCKIKACAKVSHGKLLTARRGQPKHSSGGIRESRGSQGSARQRGIGVNVRGSITKVQETRNKKEEKTNALASGKNLQNAF